MLKFYTILALFISNCFYFKLASLQEEAATCGKRYHSKCYSDMHVHEISFCKPKNNIVRNVMVTSVHYWNVNELIGFRTLWKLYVSLLVGFNADYIYRTATFTVILHHVGSKNACLLDIFVRIGSEVMVWIQAVFNLDGKNCNVISFQFPLPSLTSTFSISLSPVGIFTWAWKRYFSSH